MVSVTLATLFAILYMTTSTLAQSPGCGLDCIANVSGSNCNRGVWSCLCRSVIYLENLSACAKQACSPADYDATISAVGEICSIVNAPISISPYATAASLTNNPILSTVALGGSSSPMTASTRASSSTMDNIGGTSVSVSTTTGIHSTSSNAGATSSSTTTNIAQRHDFSRSAIQGIAVALLGLALYL